MTARGADPGRRVLIWLKASMTRDPWGWVRPSSLREAVGAPAAQGLGMFEQLIVATVMVLFTVAVHGGGLVVLGRYLRLEARQETSQHIPSFSPRALLFTMLLVLALFVLHGVEIWSYALLYLGLGAVTNLEIAVYFSTISYGGLGFNDSYMAPAWRLVSAIEGINGVLLLGWSTAFFVTVVTRIGSR